MLRPAKLNFDKDEYIFRPRHVAEATGIDINVFQSWLRTGAGRTGSRLMLAIGKEALSPGVPNKRRRFSAVDILRFACTKRLTDLGVPIRLAASFADEFDVVFGSIYPVFFDGSLPPEPIMVFIDQAELGLAISAYGNLEELLTAGLGEDSTRQNRKSPADVMSDREAAESCILLNIQTIANRVIQQMNVMVGRDRLIGTGPDESLPADVFGRQLRESGGE